jgi:hypothetical protein
MTSENSHLSTDTMIAASLVATADAGRRHDHNSTFSALKTSVDGLALVAGTGAVARLRHVAGSERPTKRYLSMDLLKDIRRRVQSLPEPGSAAAQSKKVCERIWTVPSRRRRDAPTVTRSEQCQTCLEFHSLHDFERG